jgi:hypothetical protein
LRFIHNWVITWIHWIVCWFAVSLSLPALWLPPRFQKGSTCRPSSSYSYFCWHSEVLFHVTLVWPVPLTQVFPHPQVIFPYKTWFFGIYLSFQRQKSFKNQHLSHSESKSYQINSIKSCSSRSFQQHQRHIPIPLKFSATIYFHFQ